MGWAEKRVEEYKKGKEASFWEKRCLEHAEPVHTVAMIIGTVVLVYGVWFHSWVWIGTGIGLNFLGHLYCWLKK